MTVIFVESWQNMSGELDNKHFCDNDPGIYSKLDYNVKGPFNEKYTFRSTSSSSTLMTIAKLTYPAGHIGMGFWFRATSDQNTNAPFIRLCSMYNSNFYGVYVFGVRLEVSTYGGIVYEVMNETNVASYTPRIRRDGLKLNKWYYGELEVKHADSGWIKAWLNGQFIGQFIGDTAYYTWETPTHILLSSNDTGEPFNIGPIWVLDLSAEPHNTMPLGIKRVQNLVASAAGSNTDWDVSGEASNYDAVNDDPLDTDMISSSTPGEYDTYQFQDIDPSQEVLACQLNLLGTKTGVGSRSVKTAFRSDAGEMFDMSGEHFLNLGYHWYKTTYNTNPSGEIAWTATDLISGEWGLKLQT